MAFFDIFKKKNKEIDSLYKGFPTYLKDDVGYVLNSINTVNTYNKCSLISESHFISLISDGETIHTPDRFYGEEISIKKFEELTEIQKNILHCIYSRSCNGYTRQKHVEELLAIKNIPPWAIPYIIKLCGEYVMEILEIINNKILSIDTQLILEFVDNNKHFICLQYAHMVSYWNCYYRYEYPNLKEYVGYLLFHNSLFYTNNLDK
jgi:hypothetical protein